MRRGLSSARPIWCLMRLGATRPGHTLAVFAVLLLGSLYLMRGLYIDSDMLTLLPEKGDKMQSFRTTVARFGTADVLFTALELGDAGASEPQVDYAEMLAKNLRACDDVAQVVVNARDFQEDLETLTDKVALFMTPEELTRFLAAFSEEGAEAAAARLADLLAGPMDAAYKKLLVKDPLNVLGLLRERLTSGETASWNTEGYFVDDEERLLLIPVSPRGAAADLPFSRRLMAQLHQIRKDTDAAWLEEYPGETPPKVLFAGGYPIAAAEGALVARDMVTGIAFSMISVVALFTFAFGRLRALLISGLPLVLGLCLTFGFLSITPGRLNAATSAFAALLIGLGVDFIIVLYSRYLEGRGLGLGHMRALAACARGTAQGVLLGAVTTAVTFFAFLFSAFPALHELGLITGVGILLLVVTAFAVLPALLTLLERNRPARQGLPRAFGLERLSSWALGHRRATLTAAVLLTLLLAPFITRVPYDDDVRHMRSPENPGLVAQNRIIDVFGMRLVPLMVRVDGRDEAEVLARMRDLAARLQPLVDGERLARLDAPLTYFPTQAQQETVLTRLAAASVDTEGFAAAFARALSARGLNPKPFLTGLQPMLRAVTLRDPVTPEALATGRLRALLDRYLARDAAGASGMLYCYTPAGKWMTGLPPDLEAVVAETPEAHLTGPVVVSMVLKRTVRRDAGLAMLGGTLVVGLLLALDLRGLRRGMAALFPLALGMTWTFGTMGLLGLPVNFTNIFVFTMIIGIGVDYGIHTVHRQAEGKPTAGVAKAVVIAAMTTILGFGSLVFSHYPGLRSLGVVACLGTLYTALISITVLPVLTRGWGADPASAPAARQSPRRTLVDFRA